MILRKRVGVLTAAVTGYCVLLGCSKQMPVLVVDPIPNNSVLRGVGLVTGSARAQSGIRSVVLYLDGKRASQAVLEGSNEAKWRGNMDASKFPMGQHYLTIMTTANDRTFSQQTVMVVVAR